MDQKLELYKNVLYQKFNIDDIEQKVQESSIELLQNPPKGFRRCILQVNQDSLPYCFFECSQPLNRVQTSNSSQMGTFLPLLPKYKVLIIPAEEFLMSCQSNPDMNVFFYTKHFIKNITDVKKQSYNRIYMPEICVEHWTFYKDISQKMQKTVFGKEEIQIGFNNKLSNSIIFTPHHNDLVFQKPFIISVISANVEKTIEGSPIFCKLII